MGRRARQLLVFLEDLDERKIDYISVRDGHLTGDSASGKIFRHMLVGMAEYESNLKSMKASKLSSYPESPLLLHVRERTGII